jgi:hypothetical protein
VTDHGHFEPGEMLEDTMQHILLAVDGRNAQLDTASIQRQEDAPVLEQPEIKPMGL